MGLLPLGLSWGTETEPTSIFIVGHLYGLGLNCWSCSGNLTEHIPTTKSPDSSLNGIWVDVDWVE
jgi:hypothetical protein